MKLIINSYTGTDIQLLQDLAAHDNIVDFVKDIANDRDKCRAQTVDIKFFHKNYRLRECGKLSHDAIKILNELRKLPDFMREFSRSDMSIRAGGFEHELFIDLDVKSGISSYIPEKGEDFIYHEIKNPSTQDIVWEIDDFSLKANDDVEFLVRTFINDYPHEDYGLTIYDPTTQESIDIDCNFNDIPKQVDYIYKLENGTPMTLFGINNADKSYVACMRLSRGIAKYALAKR